MFKRSHQISTFLPPGILNFKSIHVQLEDPIGYPDHTSGSYPYLGEKPGGTDVGHLIGYDNETYIVKTGITLSLLGQALKNVVEGDKEKANKKLGNFIVGSYARLANIEDKILINQLRLEILSAFDLYLSSEHAQQLQDKIRSGSAPHTQDVYQIYLSLCTQNPWLKNVIGLPAFADVVSGCYSQHVNNAFHSTQNNRVAQHRLFIHPQDKPGLFQGSRLLSSSTPLDDFLLQPFFDSSKLETQSEAAWIAQCQNRLRRYLQAISLNGLCSGILIRHIMGESADNGPDNMLLSDRGVVNIDLTGFRYSRMNQFNDALGWADTLALNTPDELLNRLFHHSVFKDRFVKERFAKDKTMSEQLKASIYAAVVTELKASVENTVVDEVTALREWLANLDPNFVNDNLSEATHQVYAKLNDEMKFSPDHLNHLIHYKQQFMQEAIGFAKTCVASLDNAKACALAK